MNDSTNITTDYDDWAASSDNLAQHIAGILHGLTAGTKESARQASVNRRWPYLVNPETGHLNGLDLCWICSSALTHSGPMLPKFRACRWCLREDRRQAARLGLLHLLPVFDWPAPPVRDHARADRLEPTARDAIADAWSQISRLDQWRRDSVSLAYSWMDVVSGGVVDLFDWQSRLGFGQNRSISCWAAYVDGYQPNLRRVLVGELASTAVQR